jgi:hypothetical protein
MAKLFKVLDPQQPSTSGTHPQHTTDWNQCVLCQTDTSETLCCPAASKRPTGGSGYKTLANHLLSFSEIGCLPKSIDLSRLDDGEGMQATFEHHGAKWHNSCRLKFNQTELLRAEKRKTPCEDNADAPRKYTRQSVDKTVPSGKKCFFCDKPEGKERLRKASTFDLNTHLRKIALKLEDKPLLAKLSGPDLVAQEAEYHLKCLVSLYNKARDTKTTEEPDQDDVNHGIALAELVSYIDEARMDALVAPVFKLVDLTTMYTNHQAGTTWSSRHRTCSLD